MELYDLLTFHCTIPHAQAPSRGSIYVESPIFASVVDGLSCSINDRIAMCDSPSEADKLIADASTELVKTRTIKLAGAPVAGVSAQFTLIFEASSKPQRVEWLEGAPEMRKLSDLIRDKEYPVRFPEISSVKIVRKATVTGENSGCTFLLLPLEGLRGDAKSGASARAK